MTFADGVATFTLKDGESRSAEGLANGLGYTVTETGEDGGKVTVDGVTFKVEKKGASGNIDKTKAASAEFTNTREEGKIKISKTVVSPVPADKEKTYSFTIELSDNTVNGTYTGTLKDVTFENGVATTTLTGKEGDNENVISGLPAGVQFKVTEAAEEDFITLVGDTETHSTGFTAIDPAAIKVAAFTNKRNVGVLVIEKEVLGTSVANELASEYSFDIELDNNTISGTFNGITFTDGKATGVNITTDASGKGSVTITGLPIGTGYSIKEVLTEGQKFDVEVNGTVKADATLTGGSIAANGKAVFKNYRRTGKLSVYKEVVSPSGSDKTDKTFKFKVTLTDPVGSTLNGQYGEMTFVNGVDDTITLKHDETRTAENLPEGVTYKVEEIKTEAEEADFLTTISGGDSVTDEFATGTIEANGLDTVSFKNIRNTGGLVIHKTVESDVDKEIGYPFTITLDDTSVNGTYGGLEFTNGVAHTTLEDGQEAVIEGLPNGVHYTVEEENTYLMTSLFRDGHTGILDNDGHVIHFDNPRNKGSLTISKELVSTIPADADQEFIFDVVLDDTRVDGAYGKYNIKYKEGKEPEVVQEDMAYGVTFDKGKTTVRLKGGESQTISNLPQGVGYTVKERASGEIVLQGIVVDGKDVDISGADPCASGTIAAENNVVFKNGRDVNDIEISKNVISDAAADKDQEFEFSLLFSKALDGEFDVVDQSGKTSKMSITGTSATITLKGGEKKTIKGLPVGVKCNVTEATVDGFTTKVNGVLGKTTELTVDKDSVAAAAFENTRETGSLSVEKRVTSTTDADKTRDYEFTVELSDKTITSDAQHSYGDISFTNGKATLNLKDGEKKTATGLPTGISYTVSEKTESGFTTTSAGVTGTISTAINGATFTNVRNEGGLSVTKEVKNGTAEDKAKNFKVKITLDTDLNITGLYGEIRFNSNVAEFTLADGETKTATGLPQGIPYTVTEIFEDPDEANLYTVSYEGQTGTIPDTNSTAVAKVINERKTGSIEISKALVNAIATDKDRFFTFDIQLSENVTGILDGVSFKDGKATIDLKGGESKEITGLPYGVTYTVTEVRDEAGYLAANFNTTVNGTEGYSVTGALGTGKSTLAFVNSRKTGGLKVTKEVNSENQKDLNTEFEFAVSLDDKSIEGTFGEMEFKAGETTFKLKNGESRTASGLPVGVGYTVKETKTDYNGRIYAVSYRGNTSGTIAENATPEVTVINTPNVEIEIPVKKIYMVNGKKANLPESGFTFYLKDLDDGTTRQITLHTEEDSFNLKYSGDETGTHKYLLYEEYGGDKNIQYSKAAYEITIEVSKDEKGKLSIAYEIDTIKNRNDENTENANKTIWKSIKKFFTGEPIEIDVCAFTNYGNEISLVKVDKNSGEEKKGAVLKVTGPEGFSKEYTTPADITEGLAAGEYKIVEVKAPYGYKKADPSAKDTFTIDEDGNVAVNPASENLKLKTDNGKIELVFENKPYFGSAKLKKIKVTPSGNGWVKEPFKGVTFELYMKDLPQTGAQLAVSKTMAEVNWYRQGTYTTDADGVI